MFLTNNNEVPVASTQSIETRKILNRMVQKSRLQELLGMMAPTSVRGAGCEAKFIIFDLRYQQANFSKASPNLAGDLTQKSGRIERQETSTSSLGLSRISITQA